MGLIAMCLESKWWLTIVEIFSLNYGDAMDEQLQHIYIIPFHFIPLEGVAQNKETQNGGDERTKVEQKKFINACFHQPSSGIKHKLCCNVYVHKPQPTIAKPKWKTFSCLSFCLKQAVHTSQDSTNFLYCLIKTHRVNRFAQIEIIKTLSDEVTELFNFLHSWFCLLLLSRAPRSFVFLLFPFVVFCSMNSCKFCKQKTFDNMTIKSNA